MVFWKKFTGQDRNPDTGQMEEKTSFLLRYYLVFNSEQARNKILFQREYADIDQLNYYIGTLNNSNLFKSEQRWVWFEYSYSCGDIKYDLYLTEKEDYLVLDIVYTF